MTETTSCDKRILEASDRVRELFLHFAKLITAKTIYTANNPTLTKFSRSFQDAFQAFFESEKELQLRVEQYRFLWKDEVVYESTDRSGSIAFMLFKDGVGEITIHPSVTPSELEQFVDIVKEEIHNPKPDSDVVTQLWEADFAGISYRVLDEDPTGEVGDGRGGGARSSASALQANDHPSLPGDTTRTRLVDNDDTVSIAHHLLGVLNATRPQASESEKESFIQDVLEKLFSLSGQEARLFSEERAEEARRDKIVGLLDTALGLAAISDDPMMFDNAERIIERATRFAVEEANIRTLTGMLSLVRSGQEDTDQPERIAALLPRLQQGLVEPAFLRSLADADRPAKELLGVLHYYREVGPDSVPVIRDLLPAVKQPVVHREACDTLLALAGDSIRTLVDSFDIDNALVARDVVYLLGATALGEVPPVARELVHYPDLKVREAALELLAGISDAGAMPLVARMLDDEVKSIRIRVLQVLRERVAADAANKVLALCFGEEIPARDMDEREQLFATAGKLAGIRVVEPLQQMMKKKTWRPFGKQVSPDEKLLAISALEQSCCEQARPLLLDLSADVDDQVKSRAETALKMLNTELLGERD